jgi:hypothetical protein
VLFFIFKSQRRVETWNLESSESSVPTTSIYFTSILPPPATGQQEEIQMEDTQKVGRGDEMKFIYSGCQEIRHGELLGDGANFRGIAT